MAENLCPSPKPRYQKLGIKPGMRVAVGGVPEPGFIEEITAVGAVRAAGPEAADLTILFASTPAALHKLPASPAFWVVYPKGVKTITQHDVLTTCRAAGFNDTKVMSFSPTHTGLRFIPFKNR